jgi:hypothetical protein
MQAVRVRQFVLSHIVWMLLMLGVVLGGVVAAATWDGARDPDPARSSAASLATRQARFFDAKLARLEADEQHASDVAKRSAQLAKARKLFERKLDQLDARGR